MFVLSVPRLIQKHLGKWIPSGNKNSWFLYDFRSPSIKFIPKFHNLIPPPLSLSLSLSLLCFFIVLKTFFPSFSLCFLSFSLFIYDYLCALLFLIEATWVQCFCALDPSFAHFSQLLSFLHFGCPTRWQTSKMIYNLKVHNMWRRWKERQIIKRKIQSKR